MARETPFAETGGPSSHIRAVVETGRRRAIDALDAIRLTLEGQPIPSAA